MPTFIYAPGIKVYIDASREGIGLVDVTEDLVEGTMVRRSDGISTFQFSLSNPQRKYDSVFTPNDRIIVMMKRLAWLRVYTGLLNSVPLITAWPMVVPITSSCSLKRLQYWYWDPNAPETQNLIRAGLSQANPATNVDGGVTNLILTVLDKVVGWPATKVHIGQIPSNWFDICLKVAQQVESLATKADALAEAFAKTLTANGAIAGGTVVGTAGGAGGTLGPATINGTLQPGDYSGTTLDADQCKIAQTIYAVCLQMGGTQRDGIIGIATGLDESGLKNDLGGDRDSQGVFQQRPSCGWGTIAQCRDVSHAAQSFYTHLLGIGNRTSMSVGQAAQAVQASGTPDGSNYTKQEPAATSIVQALVTGGAGATKGAAATPATQKASQASAVRKGALPGDTAPVSPAAVGKTTTPGGTTGTTTGSAFAQAAATFISTYPHVAYSEAGGQDSVAFLKQAPPPFLDCSSFVRCMYLTVLGDLNGMPRTTQAQVAWLEGQHAKKLTAVEAFATPGAVVYTADSGHVEISLGDGSSTIGAQNPTNGILATAWGNSNYFGFGYQLPNLSYGGQSPVVAGAAGAAGATNPAGGQGSSAAVLNNTLPGYNPNNPIDVLFGAETWHTTAAANSPDMQLAAALTGVRALLNDSTILPWIMSLFTSTMRQHCSAPNGDLIAWFPDYYGLWGTAAKMIVEPIEVQDFTVIWSDDNFITHQFALAGKLNMFDDYSGGSVDTQYMADGGADLTIYTSGIASIDISGIMYALFGIDATTAESEAFATYIYKRFGARPDYQRMQGLVGAKAEFFAAVYLFMQSWAYQYNADIPLTFMPELYPGMLIQIPQFNFQAYVTTVTHTFRFGQGGGFSTSVNIAAPARLPQAAGDRDNVLIGLPLAGNYKPGRGLGNIDPLAKESL